MLRAGLDPPSALLIMSTSSAPLLPSPGTVVLNYGDPVFAQSATPTDDTRLAQEIFLRILAYAPFAETLVVPSRYILDGAAMHQAVVWASPLLEAGVLQPTRRADVATFVDLADERRLGTAAKRRARDLDRLALAPRPVHWHALEEVWRELMLEDLEVQGAFRRLLSKQGFGAIRGRNAEPLDRLAGEFAADQIGMDGFRKLTEQHCDAKTGSLARRWAMLRYYQAPTAHDHISVREIPSAAGDLLLGAINLTDRRREVQTPEPVRLAHAKLTAPVPLASTRMDDDARRYCRAVLRIRDEIPAARNVFAKRSGQKLLDEQGASVTQALADEMKRQSKRPGTGARWTGRIAITVVGGATGFLLGGLDPLAGVGGGALAELAAEGAARHQQTRRRSWSIAIDRLEQYTALG